MLDSVGEEVITRLGMDRDGYSAMLDSWAQASEARHIEEASLYDIMMLDGMLIEERNSSALLKRDLEAAREEARQEAMMDALENYPVMLTKEQRRAIATMATPEDAQIFRQFLDSLSRSDLGSLPLGRKREPQTAAVPSQFREVAGAVDFNHSIRLK